MDSQCPKCKFSMSVISRNIPMLLECNDKVCIKCLSAVFEGQSPQDIQKIIQCPICQKEQILPDHIMLQLSQFHCIQQIEISKDLPSCYCEQHISKQIEFYCKKDNQLFCSKCVLQHSQCIQDVIEFNQEIIYKHTNILRSEICNKIQSLHDCLNKLDNIIEEKSFNSRMIIETFNTATYILQQKKFCDRELILLDTDKQQCLDSIILEQKNLREKLYTYIPENEQIILIFRGSRDGFSSDIFHKNCDNKGSTLSIVKSNKGNIFGLWTDISWSSKEKDRQHQNNSFIFSLRENDQFEILKSIEGKSEVTHSKDSMICASGTLLITDQCNQRDQNLAIIGNDGYYQMPSGVQINSQQAQDYLAGSLNFQVIDIEVFQCVQPLQ